MYADTNALFDRFLIDVADELVRGHDARGPGVRRRAALRRALPDGPGGARRRRRPGARRHLVAVAVDEALPHLGGRPRGLPLSGELAASSRSGRTAPRSTRSSSRTFTRATRHDDDLESVALDYIDRLDERRASRRHRHRAGPADRHDPRRRPHASADPPHFYLRSLANGAWSGWQQIPLDIKAHHAVPAVYRGRLCLFWPEVKVASEPQQSLPTAAASPTRRRQEVYAVRLDRALLQHLPERRVVGRAQTPRAGSSTFPLPASRRSATSRTVEALYTLKVQAPLPSARYGAALFVDVFRLGATHAVGGDHRTNSAVHVGRAVFDGRFGDLELRNLTVYRERTAGPRCSSHAQSTYGPDAAALFRCRLRRPIPISPASRGSSPRPARWPRSAPDVRRSRCR